MEKENLNKISFQRKSLKKTLRVDKGYFPYWKSLKKNLGLSYSPKKTVGCRIAILRESRKKTVGCL